LSDKWNKIAILGHPSCWIWNTNAYSGKPHPITTVCHFFEKSTYSITLSERSKGYILDKIVLRKYNKKPDLSFEVESFNALTTSKESEKIYPPSETK
jgi:hypothetical protein